MSNYSKVKQGNVYKTVKHPIVSSLGWVGANELVPRNRPLASAAPALQTDSEALPNAEVPKITTPETHSSNLNTPGGDVAKTRPNGPHDKAGSEPAKATSVFPGQAQPKSDLVSLFRKNPEQTREAHRPDDFMKKLAALRNNKRAHEIPQPPTGVNPSIASNLEATKRQKSTSTETVPSVSGANPPINSEKVIPPHPENRIPDASDYENFIRAYRNTPSQVLEDIRNGNPGTRPGSLHLSVSADLHQAVSKAWATAQNLNQAIIMPNNPPAEVHSNENTAPAVVFANGSSLFPSKPPQTIMPRILYRNNNEIYSVPMTSDQVAKTVANSYMQTSPMITLPNGSLPVAYANQMGHPVTEISSESYTTVSHPPAKPAVYPESIEHPQEIITHNNPVPHGEPSSRLFVNHNEQLMWRQSQEPFNRAGVIKQFLLYIGFTSQSADMMINSEGVDKMEVFQEQFSRFSEWCCERDYDPWTFNEVIGLNYITEASKYQDFITLEAIRDTLSSTWALVHGDRNLFKDSPRVLFFFAGLRMHLARKPKIIRTVASSDPNLPFSLFKRWGSNAELSYMQLCQKTAYLLISVTSWNTVDLSKILLARVQFAQNNTVTLYALDPDGKNMKQSLVPEFDTSPLTCPVQALRDYTQWFRPLDPDFQNQCLFGPTPNPNHRANATPQMINSWIQNLFLTAEKEFSSVP